MCKVYQVGEFISFGTNRSRSSLAQLRAAESAVILVLTHLDMFHGEVETVEEDIKASYRPGDGFDVIKAIVCVEATGPTGAGIWELNQTIQRVALDMTVRKRRHSFASTSVRLIGRMVSHSCSLVIWFLSRPLPLSHTVLMVLVVLPAQLSCSELVCGMEPGFSRSKYGSVG